MIQMRAGDLERWADRTEAHGELPRMIRSLLWSLRVPLEFFEMPVGDSVNRPGFDGQIEAAGASNPFLPEGRSVWEIGTSNDPSKKANADYRKRTAAQADGAPKSETTLIFVTPRRWQGKGAWATQKSQEGVWREVRCLDADDLEHWLSRSPAVAAWCAWKCLNLSRSIQSVEEAWVHWSEQFARRAVPELVTADRDKQGQELIKRLAGPPSQVVIHAHSDHEAAAFATALIMSSEHESLRARAFAVRDDGLLHELARLDGHIVILRDSAAARETAGAIAVRNHVLLCVGNDTLVRDISLVPRSSHRSFVDALTKMGLSADEADRMTWASGRSATVLRRRLPNGTFNLPVWANNTALIPAVLAGGWDDSNADDRDVVAALGGSSYVDWEREVAPLCGAADPPLQRIENVWHLTAPADVCALFQGWWTTSMLERLENACLRVLGELDPVLDLPLDDRAFSKLHGKELKHSDWLRRGLARSLLLIGAIGGPSASASPVAGVVRRLLADPDWRVWASLRSHLPAIAEAAPHPFLNALEVRLEGTAALDFVAVFSEASDLLSPGSPHVHVLFALERLAWSPELLRRCCMLLARLAQIDPGGRLSNRPIDSLRGILLPWSLGTNAGGEVRLAVLDKIVLSFPDIGWALLDKLMPAAHDTAMPTARPEWRDFGEASRETPTRGSVNAFYRDVVARYLNAVGSDVERLKALIGHLGALSPTDRDLARLLLEQYAGSESSDADRRVVVDTLRELVKHHQSFAEAEWALAPAEIAQWEAIVRLLEPLDPTARHRWLFDDMHPVVGLRLDDWDTRQEDIRAARRSALRDIDVAGDGRGLIELAEVAEQPGAVAMAVVDHLRTLEACGALLDTVFAGAAPLLSSSRRRLFTSVMSDEMRRHFGQPWPDRLEGRVGAGDWTPEQAAECLIQWPTDATTWDFVERLGDSVGDEYWKAAWVIHLDGPVAEVERGMRALTKAGRALSALEAGHHRAAALPAPLLIELLDGVWQEVSGSSPHARSLKHSLTYELEHVFTALGNAPDLDDGVVVRREFQFLSALRELRQPLRLHRLLARDPAFFVEVLCVVFRAQSRDSNGEGSASEGDGARAMQAYRLLDEWSLLPGATEQGDIDSAALRAWIEKARTLAAEADRAAVGDDRIGALLARAPVGVDGAWPHESVRDVLEHVEVREIDAGLLIGRQNMRGATWRTQGGEQERSLADETRGWATTVRSRWPRTAEILEQLAQAWEAEGRMWDTHDQQQALRL